MRQGYWETRRVLDSKQIPALPDVHGFLVERKRRATERKRFTHKGALDFMSILGHLDHISCFPRVVLCHVWLLAEFTPSTNLAYALDTPKRLETQPIVNGYLSVDSFLYLSGFLVAYAMLPMLEKSRGRFPWAKFFGHRYLRMTPSVAIFLLLHTYLHRYTGNGPAWAFVSQPKEQCIKQGWSILLYINNFWPSPDSVSWSWQTGEAQERRRRRDAPKSNAEKRKGPGEHQRK